MLRSEVPLVEVQAAALRANLRIQSLGVSGIFGGDAQVSVNDACKIVTDEILALGQDNSEK